MSDLIASVLGEPPVAQVLAMPCRWVAAAGAAYPAMTGLVLFVLLLGGTLDVLVGTGRAVLWARRRRRPDRRLADGRQADGVGAR